MTTATLPALTFADVTVTADRMGREVVVIPDAIAVELRREIKAGWREIPGMADGYSRLFRPGSWVYDTTAALMGAYGASDVPAHLDTRDRAIALRDREWARQGFQMHVFVVGVSGWDTEAGWWRDYDATRELHVPGNPYRDESGKGYRYGG